LWYGALRSFEHSPGLRHKRAVRIGQYQMLEMGDRRGVLALAHQQPRPVELGGGGGGTFATRADDLVEQRGGGRLLVAALLGRDLTGEEQHLEPASLLRQPGRRAAQRRDRGDRVAPRQREQRGAQLRTRLVLDAL